MAATQIKQSEIAEDGTISADRACEGCGYNLRGLPMDALCPECGAPVVPRRSSLRFVDNLTDAPLGYLRGVRNGLFMMAGGLLMWVGVPVVVFLLARVFGPRLSPRAWEVVGEVGAVALPVAFALLWWGGVVLVTRRRPVEEGLTRDAFLDSRALRRVNQTAPAALVAFIALGVAGAYMQGAAPGRMADAVSVAASAMGLVSLFALIPLALFLGSMADWAGETGIGDRLRGSAWVLAVAGSLAVVCRLAVVLGGSPVLRVLGVLLGLATGGAMLLLAWSVIQLATSAQWAIANNISGRERDKRIELRRRQREEEALRAQEEAMARAAAGITDLPPPPPDAEPVPLVEDEGGEDGGGADAIDAALPMLHGPGEGERAGSKIRHTPATIARRSGGGRTRDRFERNRAREERLRREGGGGDAPDPADDGGIIPLAPEEDDER